METVRNVEFYRTNCPEIYAQAEQILALINADAHVYGFDPLTILAIIQVIITLIKFYNECKNPADAHKTFSKPRGMQRVIMNNIIKMKLPYWRENREYYMRAFDTVGRSLSKESVSAMFSESPKVLT